MNFGQAIEKLKEGARIQRAGWNGKGQHVYLEDQLDVVLGQGGMKHARKYNPCMVLFNAQGEHQPGWNPSTSDVLAEDWQVAE